jgi:hypothetical protein
MKNVLQIDDVFTPEQLQLASKLQTANLIYEQLTKPYIEQINEKTQQENDPKYWAYLLESVFYFQGRKK